MTIYCKKCGAQLNDNAKFCPKCGEPVSVQRSASQQPAPAPYAPAAPAFQSIDYITSYLTFYLKGEVDFTANNLRIKEPNTILGLIPLGSKQRTLDVNHISSTESDFHVEFGQLVVGVIIFFFGFGNIFGSQPSFYGLVALIFGLFYALNALQTYVAVKLDSGEDYVIRLVIFQKDRAEIIADNINQMLAARTYDTNFRVHSANSADRIVDAISQR